MNRLLMLVGSSLLLTILLGILAVISNNEPSEADYKLARSRALLDAENYIEALNVLRDLPALGRTLAETHSYRGAAYLRLHLYEAAIEEFTAAIDQKPRGSDPWIGLASTYLRLGDAQKARQQADQATGVDNQSADAWIMLGRAFWLERKLDDAEKAGLKARELAPTGSAVIDLLLNVYSDQNRIDKFEELLQQVPVLSDANLDLAVRSYVRQGQFGRAWDLKSRAETARLQKSILETDLALKRDASAVHLMPLLVGNLVRAGRFDDAIKAGINRGAAVDLDMGKAYWMTGQTGQALSAFTRASRNLVHKLSAEVALAAMTGDVVHWREAFKAERIEQDHFILSRLDSSTLRSDPVVTALMYRYAALYDPELYNRAAEAAQSVLEDDPVNYDALITLGTAYQRLNRIDEARRIIELAGMEYPRSAEVWSRLANLALPSGESDKVVELMQKAVDLDPENAGYVYNLGWFYDQIGNSQRAAALYERAIQLSPLSFEAMNNLALIHGKSGDAGRALRLLEQAIQTDPDSEVAYFNLASHYVRQRDWTQALRSLDRVLTLNPANSAAAVEKGRIQLELGRADEAIETLNRALDVDAFSLDAYLLLSTAYGRKGLAGEAAAAQKEAQRVRARAERSR
jgi:tetratricopeptide (TPR) repeat protein